jgi:AraC-like DNA-binding protein
MMKEMRKMYSLDISQAIHCSRFGRMKQKNGWERSDFRSIEQNLFVFLIDGQADFQVAGHDYSLQTGDVLIIPSNTLYKAYTDDFCEYYFYHFDGQIRQSEQPAYSPLPRRFSFDLPALNDPHIYFSDHTKTAQDFHRLYNSVIACIDYHSRGSRTGQQLLECEFLKIMLMLADIGEQQQNSGLPTALSRMITFIKKNLTQPLGVEDVCNDCGISPSYAGRLFKKHMNMTVTEYINSEKLYYACELISDTGMNLSEIADYLGYCDVYYFSKRFKRKFGKSPSALKKES